MHPPTVLRLSARTLTEARAVFAKLAGGRSRHNDLSVRVTAGRDGVRLAAGRGGVAAELFVAGEQAPAAFTLPLNALPATASGEITLCVNNEEVEVRWEERGIPRTLTHPVSENDAVPRIEASELTEQPPGLLAALADAAATSDPGSLRYALGCLRLRGGENGTDTRSGQIAATDGVQLLLRGGFRFPWSGDRLVPAAKLFACRQFDRNAPGYVGCTEDEVVVRFGEWTVSLAVDKTGRFPAVDRLVPAETTGGLSLSENDREFLLDRLPGLPGGDGDDSAVTLDLNGRVIVRAKGPEDVLPTELLLSNSHWTGEPLAVGTKRGLLARALRLGFKSVSLTDAEGPAVCRRGGDAYVWAVLGKEAVVKPSADAVRVESGCTPKRHLAGADAGTAADTAMTAAVPETFTDLFTRSQRIQAALRDLLAESRRLTSGLRRHRRSRHRRTVGA